MTQSRNKGLGTIQYSNIGGSVNHDAAIGDLHLVILIILTHATVHPCLDYKRTVFHHMNALILEIIGKEILHPSKVLFTCQHERWSLERHKVWDPHFATFIVEQHLLGCGKNIKRHSARHSLVHQLIKGINLVAIGIFIGSAPLPWLIKLAALDFNSNGILCVAIEHQVAASGSVP